MPSSDKQPIIFFGAIAVVLVVVAIAWIALSASQPSYPPVQFVSSEFPSAWGIGLERYPRETGSKVLYTQLPEEEYYTHLTNRLARREGLDVMTADSEHTAEVADKIEYVEARAFNFREYPQIARDLYISDANSLVGMPVSGETLVVVWNRELLNSAGIVRPPATWEELEGIIRSGKLRMTEKGNRLAQTPVALGSFRNAKRALETVLAIYFQKGGEPPKLSTAEGFSGVNTDLLRDAIDFYTAFGNAKEKQYAWNPSDIDDLTAFAQEKAAMVIAFPSDIAEIVSLNPRIDLDVAPMFNFEGEKRANYGRIRMVNVAKGSATRAGAFQFANWLAQDGIENVPRRTGEILLPYRFFGNDINQKILEDEMLVARAWYFKPNKDALLQIFKEGELAGDFGRVFINLVILYR